MVLVFTDRFRPFSSLATGHCPVRQPRHPTVRVRPLELWQVGPPDSPVVHRTITVHCPVRLLASALTYARIVRTVHCYCTLLQSTVGAVAVTPHGTPDSSVLHRTVRWIIAEWHFPETQRWQVHSWSPWCTGQSGTPDQGSLRFSFAPFF
jgi:hypothetical protein